MVVQELEGAEHREILADTRFHDFVIDQVCNVLPNGGKASTRAQDAMAALSAEPIRDVAKDVGQLVVAVGKRVIDRAMEGDNGTPSNGYIYYRNEYQYLGFVIEVNINIHIRFRNRYQYSYSSFSDSLSFLVSYVIHVSPLFLRSPSFSDPGSPSDPSNGPWSPPLLHADVITAVGGPAPSPRLCCAPRRFPDDPQQCDGALL